MKKRLAIALSLVIITIVLISAFTAIETGAFNQWFNKKPFYVGVTFCGNSTADAEQLIDKVKDYTNLFVVQSGPLMNNLTAMTEICDYAVHSGLKIIVSYSNEGVRKDWDGFLNISNRWGNNLLGMYFNDEPGGKMLSNSLTLYDSATGTTIYEGTDQMSVLYTTQSNNATTNTNISFYFSEFFTASGLKAEFYATTIFPNSSQSTIVTDYFLNGTISSCTDYLINEDFSQGQTLWYQPSGVVQNTNGNVVTDAGNISQFETYQHLRDSVPPQTYSQAADIFVGTEQNVLSTITNQSKVKLFTSDFGLYWWDYKGGYNTVFTELFGQQNDAQALALTRGAADMQHKSWGAMIEWASQSPITMQTSDQMYSEMRQAYEDGAQYAVVFNYSPNDNGTGLLTDEHFAALQRFWTDVVQNSSEAKNVVKAQAVLVLPKDYGWGMRNPSDTIWGLWQPDNNSQQIWTALQASLTKYGSKLDIIYDDPAYPTAGRYQNVIYWNQTT